MPGDPVGDYLRSIRSRLAAGDSTEHTHRPACAALIETLDLHVQAINEPRHRTDCGAPDMRVRRGELTVGYVECKDIGVSLDEAERSEQVQRYLKHLPNLVLTDYLEFRWYVQATLRVRASLARLNADGRLVAEKGGAEGVRELLSSFVSHAPQPISTPKDLAQAMARLTHAARDIIVQASKRGQVSATLGGLHQAFEQTLIPDQPFPQFADMFAQTLAYGLFAAACNHTGPQPFHRRDAAAEIPRTNPFLRQLFDMITGVALDDEPFVGFVDDLVELLAHADMDAILRDFGKRTRKQDPIVHFYETFLAAYDPTLRKVRGVYYTPEPVISYIVRSVDYLLKTRFGLADGLADRATVEYEWQEGSVTQPRTLKGRAPRVLILDPACGTGGFLYAIVDHIREQFRERGDAGMWSGYVKEHLLPRLFGFELLMAPYAVAHLKLGMQLAAQDLPDPQRAQWAYDFPGSERLGIYLTNTLERAERQIQALYGPLRILTEEANAAVSVKRDLPIMVVLGNPPYAGHSANRGKWIDALVEDYKRGYPNLYKPGQAKWLHDDYVKFIRFGQWRIEQTGAGILAFITNHGYLDNPTFRGMRQQLMQTFTDIYILDLHGNSKKKERCPDGSKDENVFDIQQGVAIAIFVKEPGKAGPAQVHHADLWGLRETKDKQGGKHAWLFAHEAADTDWAPVAPQGPFYLLEPQDTELSAEYEGGWRLAAAMDQNGDPAPGIVTTHDEFAISWNPREAGDKVERLLATASEGEARSLFRLCSQSQWSYERAKQELAGGGWKDEIRPILYRPFDVRWTVYDANVAVHRRERVMRHMLAGRNLALVVPRRVETSGGWKHALVSRCMIDHVVLSLKTIDSAFPLYLYPPEGQERRYPRSANLAPAFIAEISQRLGLEFVPDGTGDLEATFGPEDVLHYIYAVLHSPTYRQRYAEFLKTDFPRVPLTSNGDLFRALCAKGADLVALHIMEDDYPAASWTRAGRPSPLASLVTRFPVPGDNLVDKGYPRYYPPGHQLADEAALAQGRVYINAEDAKKGTRGQYFEGVPPEVWGFQVGGYQVCDKWLKDRRGRQLAFDDLMHYQRVIVALKDTIRLMGEIDAAIPAWPLE